MSDFWQGKRVFLTGHNGFKGSWLALWLQSLGANICGYSLALKTYPNLFELAKVAQGMTSETGDVRDLHRLRQVVSDFEPEIVFHLAAQALVRESYINPGETYGTNVMGTVNLLDVIRGVSSVRAVVNITSDKCYENREWSWGYRENEPLGGHDPYSSSKACAELVTGAYRNSFFNPDQYPEHGVAIATARAGNVIGGGDWSVDRLVPDCLRAFEKGEFVEIRSPQAVRPWQHVLEPLAGYLLLAKKLMGKNASHYACAWNFGPDIQGNATVKEVAAFLACLWGNDVGVKVDSTLQHFHEAGLLRLDITQARTRLGWQPSWTFQQALEATYDWHQAWLQNKDMREYSLAQIKSYIKNQGKEVDL